MKEIENLTQINFVAERRISKNKEKDTAIKFEGPIISINEQ